MRHNREISFLSSSSAITKSITVIAFILLSQRALGQVADSFSDGDFSANPIWSGSTSVFTINTSQQLQLNNTVAGASYLSTSFSKNNLDELNWEFFIRQTFAASSSNFGRVYLVSSHADLSASLNGYYLQFGEAGTNDAVELFRQTGTTSTSICRAANGRIANSFGIRIKVSRDNSGLWRLFVDYNGGTAFTEEASGTDVTHTSSTYFGVLCIYTATNANKFFFDDFSINPFVVPDTSPPIVQSVTVNSINQLSILFSESVNRTSAETLGNYVISDGIGTATAAVLQSDNRTVKLTFAGNFPNGIERKINISSTIDLAGNTLTPVEKTFMYFNAVPANLHDLIITEFLADPSPSVGLPEVEFVEILNRSTNPFNLNGWKITDGSTTGTLTSLIVLPNEYLILAPSSSANQYHSQGKVMGLTLFPSLNNSGDAIKLMDAGGLMIDSIRYSTSWYHDEEKKDGGFSVERIDTENFCLDSENWTASNESQGGTPGKQNSVFKITPDHDGPKLVSCLPTDAKTIELEFNEKLSSSLPLVSDIEISPRLTTATIAFKDSQLRKIVLSLSDDILATAAYQIKIKNVLDCPGNLIDPAFSEAILKLDNINPSVQGVVANSSTEILVSYSEAVDADLAFNPTAYSLSDDDTHPASVTLTGGNTYALHFTNEFTNGVERTLTISQVKDLSGNISTNISKSFLYFVPSSIKKADIIITEIFPDPSPIIGLPESEFIELVNRSKNPIQLKDWQITDGTSTGHFPTKILLPSEYIIVTPNSTSSLFSSFGDVVGLTIFPSLNNSGDALVLRDAAGELIDSVKYSSTWYRDEDKRDGGWTLERIDSENFCGEAENWIASNDLNGGTPGKQNSVYEIIPDQVGPKLLSTTAVSANAIEFLFDEKLNAALPEASSFSIRPSVDIERVEFTDNTLKKIRAELNEDISSTKSYSITVSNIFDCPGNLIQPDFSKSTLKLDETKPSVIEVSVISETELGVTFSEEVEAITALEILNYSIEAGDRPKEIRKSVGTSFTLVFSNRWLNGHSYTLNIQNIADLAGNAVDESKISFTYFVEQPSHYKDIIVSEIFADQSPAIGLPEVEFLELYNRSEHPVDLKGWSISDDGDPVPLASTIILPNEYLILCLNSQAYKFSTFGNTLGVASFPSLNNSGDAIVVRNREGIIIDSVHYNIDWYKDKEKQDGGWTLELIYYENICAESENWAASEDASGGTPGRQNSVAAEKPDLKGPKLVSAVAVEADRLVVVFNEKLDKLIPVSDSFVFDPPIGVDGITFQDNTLKSLELRLSESLKGGTRYRLHVKNVYDCPGNRIDENSLVDFALPEAADSLDVVVNEILFNPRSTGVDFVEVYNQSSKYINLKEWKLATFSEGELKNLKTISESDLLFAPASFMVFTEDANILKGEYVNGIEEKFFQMDIPSLSDDKGSIVLLKNNGDIVDLAIYSDDYHSVFINDDEGVSLERLSLGQSSIDPENWKSASTAVMATPGYTNSNSITDVDVREENILVEPEAFIPMDGQPNFTTINFKFDKTGYVGTVKIYDAAGGVVKELASNELLGAEGFFRWDGDRDDGTKARIGSYMVLMEVFDEKGTVKRFRKRVVVATKF